MIGWTDIAEHYDEAPDYDDPHLVEMTDAEADALYAELMDEAAALARGEHLPRL